MVISVACFALVLNGCAMIIPTTPTPRVYVLGAISENSGSKEINISPEVIIGVGPVRIPEYATRFNSIFKAMDPTVEFFRVDVLNVIRKIWLCIKNWQVWFHSSPFYIYFFAVIVIDCRVKMDEKLPVISER